jgi:hypothetical protein
MITTTLYSVINTMRGGGNPTTFARMQLIPVSSGTEAVKPYRFLLYALFHSVQTPPCTEAMAPVVRAEPNGCQALLTFDGAYNDLEEFGWLTFIRKFDGYNFVVARQFALSFDGCRAKVGDVQLEITEQFLSSATSLPISGQKWSKSCKVDDVPWTLLFQSRTVRSCDRGLPARMLKPRWHDLLMVIKQFITCEGRYGFVFLFHLRLLMVFMGFELSMPYYLHRSLFKMAKRYKRSQADTSLFHVGLIKIMLVHELGLRRHSWHDFLSRNGFEESNPPQVDKPMVTESRPTPVPFNVLLPKPKPESPTNSPMTVTKRAKVAKPTTKKPEPKIGANSKGKKNARLISRMARNKPKPPAKPEPIVVSEDSDSDIERFLAEELPYSEGLCGNPPYDFVKNLPPCLRDNPDFPGLEAPRETLGESSKPSNAQPVATPCDQCGLWVERYYLDVPTLQSRIHDLENQVAKLTGQNAKMQPSDKKQRTTGSILFKNVESATAIVNSKLT